MKVNVALLRGINVGGRNSLPMQDLRELLDESGCRDIATYIQSGNAVFKSDNAAETLSKHLSKRIKTRFGFEPFVLILPGSTLTAIANGNPYANDNIEPKFVHVYFLADKAVAANIDGMRDRQCKTEKFTLTDNALYLRAPDGIARSKLAAELERLLGVPASGRNWKTVCKLVEMVTVLQREQ